MGAEELVQGYQIGQRERLGSSPGLWYNLAVRRPSQALCRTEASPRETGQLPPPRPWRVPKPPTQGQESGFTRKDLGRERKPVGGGMETGEGAVGKAGAAPISGAQRPGHCEGLCWALSPQLRNLLLPPLDGSGGGEKGEGAFWPDLGSSARGLWAGPGWD